MRTETDPVVGWFELLHWHHGTWVPYIVWHLTDGPMRFEDLRRAINAGPRPDRWRNPRSRRLSNSQLSVTLSAMSRDKLVVRTEDRSGVPIAVSYRLSRLVEDFIEEVARPATRWRDGHAEAMNEIWARRREHDNTA